MSIHHHLRSQATHRHKKASQQSMEIALLRKTIDCWDAYDVQPVSLSANHHKGACPLRGGSVLDATADAPR